MSAERGEARHSARLKEADVLVIRKLAEFGVPQREIGRHYPQVSHVTIHNVVAGKKWRHLLPEAPVA